MKSNTCNFGVFDWVLFLCLAVGTVEGTAVMFRYFLANSKKSLHKHCTFLQLFPALASHSCPKATRPRTVGNTNIVYCLGFAILTVGTDIVHWLYFVFICSLINSSSGHSLA